MHLASIMNQLRDRIQAYFPAILTRKYACDLSIIGLQRRRTVGNSLMALRNGILEVHSGEWLKKQPDYMNE